jgi:hypothetical protein
MNRRLRTALAVTAALGADLLTTACQGGDTPSASAGMSPDVTATAASSAVSGQASPTAPSGGECGDKSGGSSGSGASKSSGGAAAGSGSSDKSGTHSSNDTAGDKSGYGQSCGTNDISWSVTSESQAGGYYLIKAKAKPGITCVMPAALPIVAFGSDGTMAKPAEQSAGQEITLRAGSPPTRV